jgi:CheY-like chemotaxis protein
MAIVLVVDDEFAIVELLGAMIEDEGHAVLMAHDGRMALAILAEQVADVVFTDTRMPGMDGPSLVRTMRGDARLSRIPIVAMSSLPQATVGPEYPDYGVFLAKPFRLADVLRTLDRALSSC